MPVLSSGPSSHSRIIESKGNFSMPKVTNIIAIGQKQHQGQSTGQPFFLNLFGHLCLACKGVLEAGAPLSAPYQGREALLDVIEQHPVCGQSCVDQIKAPWPFGLSWSGFGLQGSSFSKGTAGLCCCCCFETGWLATSYDKTWVCSVLKTHRTS